MKRFVEFIKYNNAFTLIVLGVLTLAGSTYAASPDMRAQVSRALVQEEKVVQSVDNTYLIAADLKRYMPEVKVLGVIEDDENYYVRYTLGTIDLVDGVWQPTVTEEEMKVAKAALVTPRGQIDLGLYVTKQLKEVVEWRLSRLEETQRIEKDRGKSEKVIATAYKGLVGKYLDVKQERFPGYVPVIKPPKEEPTHVPPAPEVVRPPVEPTPKAEVPTLVSESLPETVVSDHVTPTPNGVEDADTLPPTLSLLGENPITLMQGEAYTDLGVVVTDNHDLDLVYTSAVDGVVVAGVVLDTSAPREYIVMYTATDHAGNSASITRTVVITAPSDPLDMPGESQTISPSPEVTTSQQNDQPSVVGEEVSPTEVEIPTSAEVPQETTGI